MSDGRQDLALGQFVSVAPALGNGQQHPLRLTAAGLLMVDASGGGGTLTVNAQGQYNLVPITLADEDFAPLQLDVNGYLRNTEQYAPQYEDNTNAVAAIIERPTIAVATYAPSVYMRPLAASGIAASEVIKASPASLFALNALMTRQEATTGPQFLQLFNRTTAASGGATPLASFALNFCQFAAAIADPTTDPPCFMDRLTLDHAFFSHGGMRFSSGLVWGISSTAATFTASAGVNLELHAIYL